MTQQHQTDSKTCTVSPNCAVVVLQCENPKHLVFFAKSTDNAPHMPIDCCTKRSSPIGRASEKKKKLVLLRHFYFETQMGRNYTKY